MDRRKLDIGDLQVIACNIEQLNKLGDKIDPERKHWTGIDRAGRELTDFFIVETGKYPPGCISTDKLKEYLKEGNGR